MCGLKSCKWINMVLLKMFKRFDFTTILDMFKNNGNFTSSVEIVNCAHLVCVPMI